MVAVVRAGAGRRRAGPAARAAGRAARRPRRWRHRDGCFADDYAAPGAGRGVLVGALCGLVGVHVVLRRLSFFTMAMTHATFPGVVLAALVGVDLLLGSGLFGVLVVLGVSWLSTRPRSDSAAAVGVVLSAGFALGVALLSAQSGSSRDLSAYLVGSIVTVQPSDLVKTVLVLVAVARHAGSGRQGAGLRRVRPRRAGRRRLPGRPARPAPAAAGRADRGHLGAGGRHDPGGRAHRGAGRGGPAVVRPDRADDGAGGAARHGQRRGRAAPSRRRTTWPRVPRSSSPPAGSSYSRCCWHRWRGDRFGLVWHGRGSDDRTEQSRSVHPAGRRGAGGARPAGTASPAPRTCTPSCAATATRSG